MRSTAALLLALALPPSALVDDALELPAGPVARAWAGVGPETVPIAPAAAFEAEAAWLLDAGSPIGLDARWEAWADWLALAGGDAPDPRAVAGLALIALREERWNDLWRHLETLGGHPEWLAGLMPACLPGAPLDLAPMAGGRAGALQPGVVLVPAPPPPPASPDPLRPHVRAASVRELVVGETRFELSIQIEPSGVQVDLEHLAGPPTRLYVRMPAPEGFEIAVEYVDWMRQDALRAPLPVELVPDAAPVTLYARGRPRRTALPSSPAGELPAGLRRAGLLFVPPPGGEAAPVVSAAASAIGRALGLPARVGREALPPGAAPTAVHLPLAPADQLVLLARLSARVEARLLERAPTPR